MSSVKTEEKTEEKEGKETPEENQDGETETTENQTSEDEITLDMGGKDLEERDYKQRQFEVEIKAYILKRYVETIKNITDEFHLYIDQDKIWTRAVDPGNVGMVEANLPSDIFEEYNVLKSTIGLNAKTLKNILKSADKNQNIRIEFDGKNKNLEITYGKHQYQIQTISPKSIEDVDIPDALKLTAKTKIKAKELKNGVKAVQNIDNDQITFKINNPEENLNTNKELKIQSETDTSSVGIKIDQKTDTVKQIKGKGNSMFSIEYISSITKSYRKNQTITIKIGKDQPISITGHLIENQDTDTDQHQNQNQNTDTDKDKKQDQDTDQDDKKGRYSYLIAPRIDDTP